MLEVTIESLKGQKGKTTELKKEDFLENIFITKIIEPLEQEMGKDLVAAWLVISKNKRTHLEVVFLDKNKQQQYAAE
ncbi:21758_t:CDS:2, partial [Cetraspora pellucida]